MNDFDIIKLWSDKIAKDDFPYQRMMLEFIDLPEDRIEEIINKMRAGEIDPIYPED